MKESDIQLICLDGEGVALRHFSITTTEKDASQMIDVTELGSSSRRVVIAKARKTATRFKIKCRENDYLNEISKRMGESKKWALTFDAEQVAIFSACVFEWEIDSFTGFEFGLMLEGAFEYTTMKEIIAKYFPVAEELDWRPTETIPEDYYAF